ncbi:MAG: hypothetical protein WD708_12420 [Kiritimatiellia bacterium]
MTVPAPVRIGIIGAGDNTRKKHLPRLQAIDGVSVDVVCNRQEESRRRSEGRIGELLAIDVFANCGAFLDTDRPFSWRDDIELSGLNTMALGIYYEAMARWVGHAATVNANGHRFVTERKDADALKACP